MASAATPALAAGPAAPQVPTQAQQVPTLAPQQVRDWLWSASSQSVYAVIMGARLAGLPARLRAVQQAGELLDYDCLLPGALAPAQQDSAPYLVQLKPDSAFSDWLLFEAAAALGDWGLLLRSEARLMALRGHCRSLLQARLPEGQTIALDWMDPRVLLALLPLFGGHELELFFGPIGTLVLPGPQQWALASLNLGRLDLRQLQLGAP